MGLVSILNPCSHHGRVELVEPLGQPMVLSEPLGALQVLEGQECSTYRLELIIKHRAIERGVVGMDSSTITEQRTDLVGVRCREPWLVGEAAVAQPVYSEGLRVDRLHGTELSVVADRGWL